MRGGRAHAERNDPGRLWRHNRHGRFVMEIGRIEWAFGETRDGRENNYGFIRSFADNESIYFHRNGVKQNSRLRSARRLEEDIVVYSLSPDRRGNGRAAVEVRALEEAGEAELMEGLSSALLTDPGVRKILLDKCPGAILGDDPSLYFAHFKNLTVRKAFAAKCREGGFKTSPERALADFLASPAADWSAGYWPVMDFSGVPEEDMRALCLAAAKRNIDIRNLFGRYPQIWKERAFLQALPTGALLVLIGSLTFLKENDFVFLMENCRSEKAKAALCAKADHRWFLSRPDYLKHAPEETMSAFLHTLDKERLVALAGNIKDESVKRIICDKVGTDLVLETESLVPYLSEERLKAVAERVVFEEPSDRQKDTNTVVLKALRACSSPAVTEKLAVKFENAWLTEGSQWWDLLSDGLKARILSDYKREGIITESNATPNPVLDAFLEKYYGGKRDFSIQQREAIQRTEGITLLFAVPGSGKTTVIVARAGYMAHAAEKRVTKGHLIMTFNRFAAEEMKKKYKEAFPEDDENDIPQFMTIHSFCNSVILELRRKGERFPLLLKDSEDNKDQKNREKQIAAAICRRAESSEEKEKLIEQIHRIRQKRKKDLSEEEKRLITVWESKDVSKKELLRRIMQVDFFDEEKNLTVDNVITLIGYIKNRMLSPEQISRLTYKDGKEDRPIEAVYNAYQQYLQKENLMDFDDMLFRAYNGLRKYDDVLCSFQDQYPYVSLDEVQDTSLLQHEIVLLLVKKNSNLFMVGDDDQSIYAFRGAVPSEMFDFRKRYPSGIKLQMGTNYRSDREIVRSCDRFIGLNSRRERKLMRPYSTDGGKINIVLIQDVNIQYEYITAAAGECIRPDEKTKGNSLAVLSRWNISLLPVMAYFYRHRIPFKCSKEKDVINAILMRQDAKRILNMLRYLREPCSFERFKDVWFICYKDSLKKSDLDEIQKIWRGRPFEPVEKAAEAYLCREGRNEDLNAFIEKQGKVEKIRNEGKGVCSAIKAIIKEKDYGILRDDGKDPISTWMRVYAILGSAAAFNDCPADEQTDEFLRMINGMQSNEYWHEKTDAIKISTMHSSKGMEYDRVILIDAIDDITPGPALGNEAWYDPEEERRLFYVALTRARHRLDILEVDVYHDRHHIPSRFINEYRIHNSGVNVINYHTDTQKKIMIFRMPHYVILSGKDAGIYYEGDRIADIRQKNKSADIQKCDSYAEALVYMHKSSLDITRRTKKERMTAAGRDLPQGLEKKIWNLFGVNGVQELSQEAIDRIRRKTRLFLETSVTDYHDSAKEYALTYLPVNIYKIWQPLLAMLQTARLPVSGTVKVLELGAGPGTAALGLFEFYKQLAGDNPDHTFNIDYYAVEYEPSFVAVFHKLVSPVQTSNLKITLCRIEQGDAFEKIGRFKGEEMDLVIESNMLNPNEHVQNEKLSVFMADICECMRNYGTLLLIEPAGDEMTRYLQKIVSDANKTDSLLFEIEKSKYEYVDVTGMGIVKDVIRAGIRTKEIEIHGFSYSMFERKKTEVISQ